VLKTAGKDANLFPIRRLQGDSCPAARELPNFANLADRNTGNFLRDARPSRSCEEQLVVFAAMQGEFAAILPGHRKGMNRQRRRVNHRSHSRFLAEMRQVGRQAVAQIDGSCRQAAQAPCHLDPRLGIKVRMTGCSPRDRSEFPPTHCERSQFCGRSA